MTKQLLAAVIGVALISGAASGQTYPPAAPPVPVVPAVPVVPPAYVPAPTPVPGPSTSTTTTIAPAPDGDSHTTTVKKQFDASGNEVTKKDVYREGVAGSTETHTKTETDPLGGTTTTRTTKSHE